MATESANRQGAIHFFCLKFPPLKLFPHWNEYLNTWRKKQHKYVKQFGGNELSTNEEANVNEGVLSNGGIQVVFHIWHHCCLGLSLCMGITYGAGGYRPSDKGRGGCHPDPEITGARIQKNFFRPFGPQFGLKIRGWGEGGPLPWIRHWTLPILLVTCGTQGLKCLRIAREKNDSRCSRQPCKYIKKVLARHLKGLPVMHVCLLTIFFHPFQPPAKGKDTS